MTPTPQETSLWKPILAPGRNCWIADAAVEASGLLVDGRDYYLAFYHAARQAERYILIAGWRFNSDVRLLRGKDADENGGEVKFLPFLKQLCETNPQMRMYVLAWDFSIIYAHEWELFQEWKFRHASPGQLQFLFDDQHAVGGSHHQKFVVIDGRLAFVGGLDFNADDWDDRQHIAHNPLRADSGRPRHEPYHDIQAYVAGAAAQELAAYFQVRWRAAGGGELDLPPPRETPLTVTPAVPVKARQVALSHNQSRTLTEPKHELQIRQLYLDAIDAAQELIYLENQYFSSQAVFQALLDRMQARARPQLDIVLILPKRFPAWIETLAVGPPRFRMLEALREAAQKTGHRLGVYYITAAADNGEEVPIVLHSKLLIVDDRFLTVGSCNTSNRSMGLDSELNVSWEASSPSDHSLARSICRARTNLLAEYCGLNPTEAWRRLHLRVGLVECVDRLDCGSCDRLKRLTPEVIAADQQWVQQLARWGFSFDPEKPLIEEALYEQIMPTGDSWLARGIVSFRDWLKSPDSSHRAG
jgi:phospholipase D1/2